MFVVTVVSTGDVAATDFAATDVAATDVAATAHYKISRWYC